MASTVTLALALLFFHLFLVSIIKYRFRIKGSTVGKPLTERKADGLFLTHQPCSPPFPKTNGKAPTWHYSLQGHRAGRDHHDHLLHLPTVRSQTGVGGLYYFIKQSLPLLNNTYHSLYWEQVCLLDIPRQSQLPSALCAKCQRILKRDYSNYWLAVREQLDTGKALENWSAYPTYMI